MYELFEHTADLGLRIRAADLNALFADAGKALFSAIVDNLDDVRPAQSLPIALQGDQVDYLLIDWLNELLYVFESRRLLLARFEVLVKLPHLRATVAGEPIDTTRHRMEHEVKAITYHGLKVERRDDGWLAEVIVDI